jgi:hypothetical protein
MKNQDGRPRSSFFWPRWLKGDAVTYIAAFVLLCVLLLYFFFALTFKYFDEPRLSAYSSSRAATTLVLAQCGEIQSPVTKAGVEASM